ncbi:site-specific DNA-methyltransferase [Mesorhizobium sp. 10J20-29]
MTTHVTNVPIDMLVPYAQNARTHSKAQIRQIANSITKFGFTNPLLIDENNAVLAGHGRLAAAKQLELREVPCLRYDHMSDADKRAYRIADNRIAEKAGWDKEILAIEFEALTALDFDLEATGFEIAEVDVIIGEFSPENQDDADDELDKVVTKPAVGPAVTQTGDLFLLGDHRLLCGSSLSSDDFTTLMQGETADVCFVDFPYNVPVSGHVSGLGQTQHREFAMASGEMSPEEFVEFLYSAFGQIALACKQGAIVFACMDWRHVEETIRAGKATLGQLLNLCVWNKTNAGMGSLYRSQHELVLVLRNGSTPHANNVELGKHGRYRTNVWTYRGMNSFGAGRMDDLAAHPTVKPTELVKDALLDVSRRGDIVLDPFGGSGTTLLAAHKIGRRARLIEIDPAYCDLTIRRFEKHTGKQARLAETGETFEALGERRRQEALSAVSGESTGPSSDVSGEVK